MVINIKIIIIYISGHCERMDGKNVRVVDYYCGTIIEYDCFIPSQGLIKGDIVVLKYGFYYFLKIFIMDN